MLILLTLWILNSAWKTLRRCSSKMGFKEFIKPTKKKVIAYIILILISGFSYLLSRASFGTEPPIYLRIIIYLLVLPPIYLLTITNINALLIPINERGLGNLIIFLLGLILVLIYQYLIICICAWIISKIKSRRQTKQ